jgi:putative transposase
VDRGLAAFAVVTAADGTEVGRYHSPKPLQQGMAGLRRQSRAAARTRPGSRNRVLAIRRLSRRHARIANVRQTFLHGVSSQLIQTHDRLCLEDLAVANLLTNRHLAPAIADAAWAEFARQLCYKAAWFGVEVVVSSLKERGRSSLCEEDRWVFRPSLLDGRGGSARRRVRVERPQRSEDERPWAVKG